MTYFTYSKWAMSSIEDVARRNVKFHVPFQVKPLGVIWGKYPQYSSKNTIMFDDIRRNFIMNPKSGLKIRPFRQAHLNRDRDRELLHLSTYLKDISQHCEDFDTLNHNKWEKYRPEKNRTQHAGSKRKAEDNPPTSKE
jgi:ubiquitin-like domain-containing CTD phosphatase 1